MHVIPRPILRRDPIEEGRQVVAQLSRQIADTRNLATVALAQFTHAARPSVTPKPPAAEQLLNVATAIAKKHRILLRDAIAVATHERPELAQQYRDRFVRP